MADVEVNQDAMQAVSLQRGVAVKEYLAFKELLLNRLFLGATKSGNVSASGLKIDPAPDAKTDTPTGREMDATRRAQHRHATALPQICQNPV